MAFSLDYTRRLYDWWGRHGRFYRLISNLVLLGREDELRRATVRCLGLSGGEAILDLACGNGANFPALQHKLGAQGRLIGLDYSETMLQAASERVRHAGWKNVELVRADAAQPVFVAGGLDAALSTLALTAIPHHHAALDNVFSALHPGGRFAVLDASLFDNAARIFNPLLNLIFKYVTNWAPERDLFADLESRFDKVSVRDFNAGSIQLLCAQKGDNH
ncbi:MAG: class I SAM-dependent methyltransferase [Candidatus Promineifilaceae bacterium]|nr:class I SAM-dependent methyltransferase [Candidatus Promineifilaceae bacterium]